MTCSTFNTSMAYCNTDRQFRSEWTTMLATLRWTNSSPGASPTISFAGTRLSEQPIQRYRGDCCATSERKNCGSRAVTCCAQRRLLSNRCESIDCAPILLSLRDLRSWSMSDVMLSELWASVQRRFVGLQAPPRLTRSTIRTAYALAVTV